MLASIKLLSKICGPSCLKYLVLVKSKWLDDDRALYKLDTLVPEASCLTKDDKNLGSTKASISALLNSLIQPGFVLSEKLAACQEFIWKQETFSATTPGVEVQDFLTKKLVDQQEKFRSNRHDVAGGDAARLLPIWESQVDILLLQWALIRFTGSSNIYKDVAQKVEEDAGVEKAMTRLTAIISLQSDLHSDKGNKVAQLGDMYNAHFKLYGKTEDLTVAIKQYDQAAALIPDDDLEKKAEYLSILGSHLQKKFQLFGDKNDVLRAIQACKDAVDLQYRADGSDNANLKKALAQHALGALLKKKFADYFDDPNDIDGAIDCFNEAKRFTPYGHRANQIIFSDLCHSHVLKSKYHSMKNDIPAAVLDIETAIEQYNRTLPEPGPDHPGYAMILDAKCMAYAKHHKLVKVQGNPSKHTPDIHEAIRAGEMAAEHGKETPQECAYLLNLGKAYWYSYEESRQAAPSADGASSLTKAVDCFHHAAQCDTADKMVRFKAARNWAKLEGEKLVLATKKDPTVTLRAYEYCIILLAEIAGQEIPIHEQYRRLERIQKVVHQATAAAITHDRLDKAVEFFEEGRSVIWRHYFKHDVVMQALKEKDPEKAKEYSLFLDKLRSHAADAESSTTYFKATVGDKDAQDNSSPGFMGRLAARASALVTKAKNAIKGLMGFEFFGMYKKLSILDNAAENGPIILINLCDEQCDALIIQWKKPVVRVNLPAMNNTKAEELQKDLRVLLGEGTSHARGPLIARGIKPALSVDTTLRENSMETILKELWITVVGPVVKALDKSYNKKSPLSHIFWCSSGHLAFLPLHAAGDYAFKDPKSKEVRILPSLFHSSYIPNIFAMLRRHNGDDSGSKFQLLAVAQSNTPNQLPLPQTIPEVDHLKNHSVAKDFSTVLKNEEGSVERVKEELLKSQWAHFACHGVQDRVDGLKSALLLEGGNKLTLKDLVDLKIPLAEFAFLSACQSAKGDITLPEEHIHLAAGMIVAGYQGVVATMWSIKDEDGLSIAKAVYDKLFAEKKGGWFGGSKGTAKPDFKEAVGALNEAVTDLRVNGKADYLRWVPFVHIGL
ncbi:CHAT domain-containing protein [Ephemerocybe angulata]|uniref:CHAT domain-containing protein n=1 Tax=Ephemerocybe angulata TaxID=980116 RepID=A0A8H6M482_9AGAR|nr:CHAT domain-containing protein [Tulosesus angulatus]